MQKSFENTEMSWSVSYTSFLRCNLSSIKKEKIEVSSTDNICGLRCYEYVLHLWFEDCGSVYCEHVHDSGPLQLWAGLTDCLIRGPQTYRPLKGWKVPSSESWPGGWVDEENRGREKERGMATFVYPTAPLFPVSMLALNSYIQGCTSDLLLPRLSVESLFLQRISTDWKYLELEGHAHLPKVLIFIAMKF